MLLFKQCTNKFPNHINLRQIYRSFDFRSLVHLNFLMWAWVPSVFSGWLALASTFLWSYPCHSYASVKWWIHTFLKSSTDEKQEIIKNDGQNHWCHWSNRREDLTTNKTKWPYNICHNIFYSFNLPNCIGHFRRYIQFLSCWVLRL